MLNEALDHFEAEILENGNLRLSLYDFAVKEDLQAALESGERSEDSYWYDLFEKYSCNGSFSPFNPESHFIGLTSDPYIITEESAIEDNGDLTVYGRVWHCPRYMLESVLECLVKDGYYDLTKAFDCGEGETFPAHHNR